MSSEKNGFNSVCETLLSLSEEAKSGAKKSLSWAENFEKEASNGKVESAEEFCLALKVRSPDGKPYKGEAAVKMKELLFDTLSG